MLLLLSIIGLAVAVPTPTSLIKSNNSIISWETCVDNIDFQCAYVTAPMNYLNSHSNLTVSIAIRRFPATVSSEEKKGTLFINPGGPGGSGTDFVNQVGGQLSEILGGTYDILGFDPRSVNQTTPGPGCFGDAASGNLFSYDLRSLGLPYEARLYPAASPYLHNTSDPLTETQVTASEESEKLFLTRYFAMLNSTVKECEDNGNLEILKSSTTAFVARDMKQILQALGEEDGGLNYWGFSYGSILGATFAAMFPELVNRIVVDGVSDSVSYTNNIFDWGTSGMEDNEETYYGFLDTCVSVGPTRCALSPSSISEGDNTHAALHSRITALSASLLQNPLPVATSSGSGVLRASHLHTAIFQALYSPVSWQVLAEAIAAAEKGNGEALWKMVALPGTEDFVHKDWDDNVTRKPLNVGAGLGPTPILCTDSSKDVWKNSTLEQFQEYVQKLDNMSSWSGENWAFSGAPCKDWPYEPYEAYRGPWTVSEGFRKTKHPILFVSNTYDPATPLSAAKAMSKGFGDSATLLIQDGAYGHCSTANPSLCTVKAINEYFLNGVVPEYGTKCVPEPGYIFPEPEQRNATLSRFTKQSKSLLDSMAKVGKEVVDRTRSRR